MTQIGPATYDPNLIRTRLLSAAVSSSPVAVFAVDAKGTVVFAQGGGLGSFTGGIVELEGLALLEAWGETPALVTAIAGALAGTRFAGSVAAGEKHFDVRVLPLRDTANGICGAAGLAVAADAPVLDASGKGAARVLETLLECLPLSIWVLDQRGDVVRDNALARESGRTAVRTARENGSGGTSLIGCVLLQGRASHGVARLNGSTGFPVDVPIRGVPLRNENGKTVGAIVLASPPEPSPAPPSLPDSAQASWWPPATDFSQRSVSA